MVSSGGVVAKENAVMLKMWRWKHMLWDAVDQMDSCKMTYYSESESSITAALTLILTPPSSYSPPLARAFFLLFRVRDRILVGNTSTPSSPPTSTSSLSPERRRLRDL